MPQVDYSNSTIYKLCCKDTSIKDIYIGSTTNFRQRKSQHKNCCNNENNKHYNYRLYKFIRENGGFDNWEMFMIEEFKCENKLQKLKKEREWIEKEKPSLNSAIPSRTPMEWYYDNKEEKNKKQRENYYLNKEKMNNSRKEYHQKNIIQQRQNHKEYYERTKNLKNTHKHTTPKIECPNCKVIITTANKARHLKTKKCINFVAENI
tara:strand:- start:57 stop:674 length:618 start_codon:yes stop_codon:yes gene_type:complete